MSSFVLNSLLCVVLVNIISDISANFVNKSMIETELTNLMLCTEEQVTGKMCYNYDISDDQIPLLEERKIPFKEDAIFFIDTSCNGGLTLRQACAIEAAALANPTREINVLFAGPITTRCLSNSPTWELLHYENINLYRLSLNDIFKNTPLEILILATERRFPLQYIADVLRFVVLYKFGGVYLDMDLLVVKSLDRLPGPRNWVAKVDNGTIGAGAMAFSRRGVGQIVADAVLRRYRHLFRINTQLSDRNEILTEVIQKVCEGTGVELAKACSGITIYDPIYFYPVSKELWKYFFSFSYYETPAEPFAYYIWNYNTNNIYQGSLYALLIEHHCPKIKDCDYELEKLISA